MDCLRRARSGTSVASEVRGHRHLALGEEVLEQHHGLRGALLERGERGCLGDGLERIDGPGVVLARRCGGSGKKASNRAASTGDRAGSSPAATRARASRCGRSCSSSTPSTRSGPGSSVGGRKSKSPGIPARLASSRCSQEASIPAARWRATHPFSHAFSSPRHTTRSETGSPRSGAQAASMRAVSTASSPSVTTTSRAEARLGSRRARCSQCAAPASAALSSVIPLHGPPSTSRPIHARAASALSTRSKRSVRSPKKHRSTGSTGAPASACRRRASSSARSSPSRSLARAPRIEPDASAR